MKSLALANAGSCLSCEVRLTFKVKGRSQKGHFITKDILHLSRRLTDDLTAQVIWRRSICQHGLEDGGIIIHREGTQDNVLSGSLRHGHADCLVTISSELESRFCRSEFRSSQLAARANISYLQKDIDCL